MMTDRELYELRECFEIDCSHVRCKARREIYRLREQASDAELFQWIAGRPLPAHAAITQWHDRLDWGVIPQSDRLRGTD